MSVDDPSRFANRFRVRSPRLPNWDYSSPGIYFVTICTYCHNQFFGKIVDNKMVYSACGQIAHDELLKTINIRQKIKIDSWVIMPNHVHLLINLKQSLNAGRRDVARYVSTGIFSQISPESNSISSIIRAYKSAVKKQSKELGLFFSWQPRFYDEIITTQSRHFQIKNYIINNPSNWQKDKFYQLEYISV